jgi:hypothetical protein
MRTPRQGRGLDCRHSTCAVGLALIAFGLGGCSGGPSPQSQTEHRPGAATSKPARAPRRKSSLARPIYRAPAGLLGRHDLPPHGVKAQVNFFEEGGPPGCWKIPPPPFSLVFGRGELHGGRITFDERQSLEPEQGETFAACVGVEVGDETPVEFTMRAPNGRVQRASRAAGGTEVPWYTSFSDDAPLGRYSVEARQGSRRIIRKFTLRPPSQPEYHIERALDGRGDDIALLGLKPSEAVRIAFYEGNSNGQGTQYGRYVTSVKLRAGSDGKGVFRFDFGRRRSARCVFYVAKVQVGGRWLDDLYNTISEFTPPCE